MSLKTKLILALSTTFILVTGGLFLDYYLKYYKPNINGKQDFLFIKTGSDFNDVYKTIKTEGIVDDTSSFLEAAKKMGYSRIAKSGKYRLKPGMSNRAFINMLKAGNQEAVKISFQNVRLKHTLAGMISKKLECDSASISNLLDSTEYVKKLGFNSENVYTMFIPNSYEIYWNSDAEKFLSRMHEEYIKFWNKERKSKAEILKMTQMDVSILASIVDSEALNDSEMPKIAGLYMNRLAKGMRLEADPTVIYAANDFTIRRVLNKHLRINSPYNTYLNKGLPPGPITMPSINAIDAVLNYEKHDYIYMCAKEDFSGYHNYASDLSQHLINAKKFQDALNMRNIKK
jgi:UPF0755 protein